MKLLVFSLLCGVAILISCDKAPAQPSLTANHRVVLGPGESLEFRNKNGHVRWEYDRILHRKLYIDGLIYSVEMIPRDEPYDRLPGATGFGIIQPASRWGAGPASSPRIVAVEETLILDSQDRVGVLLSSGSNVYDWVHTDDGLIAGYFKSPGRNQINITIYQLVVGTNKASTPISSGDGRSIEIVRTNPRTP